jgi:uncharacterized small protein (DUF1192 family)
MSAALQLYEQLTEAPDDKTRARLIAEAFDVLEARFPQINDLATQGHLRESELRLQKEIEQIRAELKLDIAQLHAELKLDIAQLRAEVERTKTDLLKWIVPLMFAQVAAIAALVKLL